MLVNILLTALLCSFLSAETFSEFLEEALEKSPYLQSHALNIEQSQQKGLLLTKYKNPSLEAQYANFDSDIAKNAQGYSVNVTQPIQLWGVASDKKRLATQMSEGAQSDYAIARAKFIRDIALAYVEYAEGKMLLALSNEEHEIAKVIYNISKERYAVGTISKGVMLQSRVAYELIAIENNRLALKSEQRYYSLLKFAGVTDFLEIQTPYEFTLLDKQTTNPNIMRYESREKEAYAQSKVDTHRVNWVAISAEYEVEPEQNIARVGVNIPLAIFNDNSQKRAISQLEAREFALLIKNENRKLSVEIKRLDSQREHLKRLQSQNEKILKSEKELLQMFQDGYKIANVKLLELQDIKNKMIETKEALIAIKSEIYRNIIITNYIQGSYNE